MDFEFFIIERGSSEREGEGKRSPASLPKKYKKGSKVPGFVGLSG